MWDTLYSNDYLKVVYLTHRAVDCKATGLNLADITHEVLELFAWEKNFKESCI